MIIQTVWYVFRSALRTVWIAIRTRPHVFVIVALSVFLLNLFLPPVVLSVVRKPWDFFTFNPWLHSLPKWLASPEATIGRKLGFVWDLALFWFTAGSSYDEPEWGFYVGVHDVVRWFFISGLLGTYFALWFSTRAQLASRGRGWRSGGRGGFMGALVSTLGLSTAPCSVAGCGAPILPVLGLAFTGLTSGVLAALSTVSRVAGTVMQVVIGLLVLAMAWFGSPRPQTRAQAGHDVKGSQSNVAMHS